MSILIKLSISLVFLIPSIAHTQTTISKPATNCEGFLKEGKVIFSSPTVLRNDLFNELFRATPIESLLKDPQKAISAKIETGESAFINLSFIPRVLEGRSSITMTLIRDEMAQISIDTFKDGKTLLRGITLPSWVANIFINSHRDEVSYELPQETTLYIGINSDDTAVIALNNFEGQDQVVVVQGKGKSLPSWRINLENYVINNFTKKYLRRDEIFVVK